jgi:hypothetical protein
MKPTTQTLIKACQDILVSALLTEDVLTDEELNQITAAQACLVAALRGAATETAEKKERGELVWSSAKDFLDSCEHFKDDDLNDVVVAMAHKVFGVPGLQVSFREHRTNECEIRVLRSTEAKPADLLLKAVGKSRRSLYEELVTQLYPRCTPEFLSELFTTMFERMLKSDPAAMAAFRELVEGKEIPPEATPTVLVRDPSRPLDPGTFSGVTPVGV